MRNRAENEFSLQFIAKYRHGNAARNTLSLLLDFISTLILAIWQELINQGVYVHFASVLATSVSTSRTFRPPRSPDGLRRRPRDGGRRRLGDAPPGDVAGGVLLAGEDFAEPCAEGPQSSFQPPLRLRSPPRFAVRPRRQWRSPRETEAARWLLRRTCRSFAPTILRKLRRNDGL